MFKVSWSGRLDFQAPNKFVELQAKHILRRDPFRCIQTSELLKDANQKYTRLNTYMISTLVKQSIESNANRKSNIYNPISSQIFNQTLNHALNELLNQLLHRTLKQIPNKVVKLTLDPNAVKCSQTCMCTCIQIDIDTDIYNYIYMHCLCVCLFLVNCEVHEPTMHTV